MNGEIKELLDELKRSLETVYGTQLRALYLFGSHAHGIADAESDVDVAIVLDDFDSYAAEVERTSRLVSEISLKHGLSISPVRIRESTWAQDDFPFFANLRKEGIPL